MNRRLFEDLVVSARGKRGARNAFAVPASVGLHAAVIGGAVVLSLFGPGELLPEATARPVPIVAPVVQVVPPPPQNHVQAAQPPQRRRGGGLPGPPRPVVAPTFDTTGPVEPPDVTDVEPGIGDCTGDCDPTAPPGPSMADFVGKDDASGTPTTVRAISDVAPPVKIRNVDPVYPDLARRANVEGVVIIECTIDPKGHIANARVLRGHPLLDGAALGAVQRWAYTPTLLNGAPVSVIMTVTVHFKIPR